ncbi:MAG: D-2-hydroxyacid dehydrogenase [Candidatus Methanomethyliales bacterium]|nr:D-2-hydroxyacid dehydrogenase [Candidatus Methanomethylicales archaeon]
MKVLIADEVDQECPSRLKAAGFDVKEWYGISQDDLKKVISDYEILVVRSRTKVTKEIIDLGKSLKMIARVGVGLDTIDVEAAQAKGIKVINTPQMSTVAVAELTISLMLNLLRGTHKAIESMKKGLWEKKHFYGNELHGKVLGIVGFGRIGRAVAERAHAFGMKILVYDLFVDNEVLSKLGASRAGSIEALLSGSDIVTLHVTLTPETKHMINARTLSLMRRGSYLINTSRGEVVNTKDLLEAVKSGQIAGAALDVYENEPPREPWERELISLPNVIATPHIGAQTREAQVAGAIAVAENIINAFKTL